MKVGELCRRLGVPYRDVRYVLERGAVPPGLPAAPGRGEHRALDPGQAFWLGAVLALKRSGLLVPTAVRVTEYARVSVRTVNQSLRYDPDFDPFNGHLGTAFEHAVEVADLTGIRFTTTAHPSGGGRVESFQWALLDDLRAAYVGPPVVVVRLELSGLAARLR